MKKHLLKFISSLTLLLTVNQIQAFELNGLYYNILSEKDKTVELIPKSHGVLENNYVNGDLVIPDQITYNGEIYTVTTIGEDAFRGNRDLTSISIPETITTIESYAFSSTGITSLTIGKSITTIELPNFNYCDKLPAIEVSDENPNFCSIDGVLYNKDITKLFACPSGYLGNNVNIPETVTDIAMYAFDRCKSLTTIKIPQKVKYIRDYTFAQTSLTDIIIPDGVASIAQFSFKDCTNLTTLTLGEGIWYIDNYAFLECTNLKTTYSKTTEPSSAEKTYFMPSNVFETATLYVPIGYKEVYMQKYIWKQFKHVYEMDFSGIGEIETDGDIQVSVENGAIIISGNAGTTEIYSTSGQLVYRGNDHRIDNLSHGIYIVRAGNKTIKLAL